LNAAVATIGALRPLPLASGLGNAHDDPAQFRVRGAGAEPREIQLESIENLLWWEFDGARQVSDAVSRIVAVRPDITVASVSVVAVGLVLKLMAYRLLYIDRAV
jgi:hypothetical protein